MNYVIHPFNPYSTQNPPVYSTWGVSIPYGEALHYHWIYRSDPSLFSQISADIPIKLRKTVRYNQFPSKDHKLLLLLAVSAGEIKRSLLYIPLESCIVSNNNGAASGPS